MTNAFLPIVVFTCAQCLSNVYPDVIVKKFRLAEVIVKIRWMKSNVIVCGKRLMMVWVNGQHGIAILKGSFGGSCFNRDDPATLRLRFPS